MRIDRPLSLAAAALVALAAGCASAPPAPAAQVAAPAWPKPTEETLVGGQSLQNRIVVFAPGLGAGQTWRTEREEVYDDGLRVRTEQTLRVKQVQDGLATSVSLRATKTRSDANGPVLAYAGTVARQADGTIADDFEAGTTEPWRARFEARAVMERPPFLPEGTGAVRVGDRWERRHEGRDEGGLACRDVWRMTLVGVRQSGTGRFAEIAYARNREYVASGLRLGASGLLAWNLDDGRLAREKTRAEKSTITARSELAPEAPPAKSE